MLTKIGAVRGILEDTAGTAKTPTIESLVENPVIARDDNAIDRTAPLPSGGTRASVEGPLTGTFSGRVELRSNGAGGLDPFVAMLLNICGSKLSTATYSPQSAIASQKTATIHVWQDGVRKGLYGAHGNVKLTAAGGGDIIYVEFELKGKWLAPVDEAVPAVTPNTALPFRMRGATFKVHGYAAVIGGFTFDTGCNVIGRQSAADANVGILHFASAGHAPTFTFSPEATTVATHDWHGLRASSTEDELSLAMTDGTVTLTLTAPTAQYRSVADGDREGIRTNDITMQINVGATADSDWTLVVS